jgi:hypothetical protein
MNDPSICIGCGLCCDGTLHGRTTVRADDERNVAAAGLTIEEEGPKRFFRQPCPRFSCGSCSIYAQRPQVCRTYRCALLKKLESRKISESEARERIATAKRLIAIVQSLDASAITPGARADLARRLRHELSRASETSRGSIARNLLDLGALEHFLNSWFLSKEDADTSAKTG